MLEEIEVEIFSLRVVVYPLYRSWFDPPLHLVAEIIPMMDQLLEVQLSLICRLSLWSDTRERLCRVYAFFTSSTLPMGELYRIYT